MPLLILPAISHELLLRGQSICVIPVVVQILVLGVIAGRLKEWGANW